MAFGNLVTRGLDAAIKQVKLDSKQHRFAGWKAINATAKKATDKGQRKVNAAFNRPTKFTQRALRTIYATKQSRRPGGPNIEAGVGFKDVFGKNEDGETVKRVLSPHVLGGPRSPKPSERRLQTFGIIRRDEYLVPSRSAPLDAYGNVRRGIMQRILSDLYAYREAGYDANRKDLSKAQYILGQLDNGFRGIFRVQGGYKNARRGRWRLIFLIVRGAPRYRKRVDLYGELDRAFDKHFTRIYDAELKKAYASARR